MNINTTKIISLLFFIFSAFYLYTAYQIQVFAFDENAPFNARTFPIYLGYAGLFFSGLKLILPDPNAVQYIPYDAGGKALAGLLSGETQIISTGLGELMGARDQVRIIGITAP